MTGTSRIGRGWALAKQSWAVLRADRSLLLFPIVSACVLLAAALIVAGPGVVLLATDTAKPVAYVLWAIAVYLLTFIGIWFNVALAAAASKSLDGHDTTLSDGFSVARQRTGVIARWAVVQLIVGLLLQALEGLLSESPLGRIVAQVITGLLSAAWSVITFFVVPILALEGVGPKEALSRSAHVIKARWGEGFVGAGSITGLVFLLLILPAIVVGAIGVSATGSSPALGGILIGIAVVVIVIGALLGSTLNAIFRVALYRFATEGQVVAGFHADALEHAFRPKRSRRAF
ncbi:MAG TPA: DUF6159 family protein [Conexibacter sp.]